MVPLILGAQRFSCSAGLAVEKSDLQRGVAGSLGWMTGEVSILTPDKASSLFGRRLNDDDEATDPTSLTPECTTMVNIMITGGLAIVLTLLLQLILVAAWRHLVNRRYYRSIRRVAPDNAHNQMNPAAPQSNQGLATKFFPFPKSLVWPTPLVFICCIFLTGLTRASVRVLATVESGAWSSITGCMLAALATLTILAALVLFTVWDLWIFYRRHGSKVHWKKSARAATPREIGDPMMRLHANTRLLLVSTALHAKRRASETLPRRSTLAAPARPTLRERRTGIELEPIEALSFDDTLPDDDETSAQPLPPPGAFTTSAIRRLQSFSPLSPSQRQGYLSISPSGRQPGRRPLHATSFSPVLPHNGGRCAPPSPPPSAPESPSSRARPLSVDGGRSSSMRRSSFVDSRAAAAELLAARRGGLRDRSLGAFALPDADTAEPARTERLLKRPFALRRARTGDAFQAHEGFILFRVNGSSRVGVIYRLLVVLANATFGVLSGLAPLLAPGSTAAAVQTGVVLGLQLLMAWLCFMWVPDADRIISLFAGTQFLLESVSTGFLLSATLLPLAGLTADIGNVTDADASVASVDGPDWPLLLRLGAFWVGLLALGVPVLQMVEQRCITPYILVVRSKGGSPLALCSAAYMLASSLPRMIQRLVETAAGLQDVEEGRGSAVDGATADAGDDAAGGAGPDADAEVGLSGEAVLTAGHNVSKLGARGLAAKEVSARHVEHSPGHSPDTPGRDRGNSTSRAASSRAMTAATAETADNGEDDAGVDI